MKAPVRNTPNVSRAAIKAAIAAGTFRKLKMRVAAASNRATKSPALARKPKPVWKRPVDAWAGPRDMDEIDYAPPKRKRAIAMKMETPENVERKRCQQLTALQTQADRLGVKFNAARAIERGMSVSAARAKIMNAAASADADEISTVAARASRAAPSKTLSREAKVSAWKKAVSQSELPAPSRGSNAPASKQMTQSAKVSAWKKATKRDA